MKFTPGALSARRRVITAAALVAASALVLTGCSGSADAAAEAGADCESTTSAGLLLGTADLDVSYIPYGILADELGYFAEECIDLSVEVAADGTLQSLLADKTDFAMGTPSIPLTAADGEPIGAKLVYNLIPDMNIYLGVLGDSDIESVEDLKGATIGVSGSSPFYDAYMERSLSQYGLSLADVTVITTGYGATPTEALESGEVDAVLYWPGLFTSWKLAGYDIRILDGTEWSADFDGIGIIARDDTIENDPELVEGFARAVAKSSVYLQRFPESAVKLFWEAYPERAPLPGADEEEALANDLEILDATLVSMDITEHDADYSWGVQTAERWDAQIEYLKTSGIIGADAAADPSAFFTDEFTAAANDFDRDDIVEVKP